MIKARTLAVSFLAVLMLAGATAVPAYAYAHGDEETLQTTAMTDDSKEKTAAERREDKQERVREFKQEYQERAQKLLDAAKARQDKLQLAKEERLARCEERKSGLLTRAGKITTSAQRHLAIVDGFFAKAVEFQQTEQLNVAGYDGLVAVATEAQNAAKASVQALVDLKPTEVDCTDGSAEQVATFKAAAAQARTDLSAYKKSVKAILVALREAKQAAEEGGEQ